MLNKNPIFSCLFKALPEYALSSIWVPTSFDSEKINCS